MTGHDPIYILSDSSNIFCENGAKYVIPLYQRSFAWGEKEIVELLEDIDNFDPSSGARYFLGSLVVYKRKDGTYEVIDGQQRLTALYVLLNSLGVKPDEDSLTFQCRNKSNYTLKRLNDIETLEEKEIETNIVLARKIMEDWFSAFSKKQGFKDTQDFKEKQKEKLKHICIYRIKVPEHTDLNRYFEVMNTRGEQLEAQDIVKSDLMSNINDGKDRDMFASIWEACSDMTGYVQMHFPVEDRNNLFPWYWDSFPDDNALRNYKNTFSSNSSDDCSIYDIIDSDFNTEKIDDNDEGKRTRFESIIDFRYFLLHALRVYVENEGIIHKEEGKSLINNALDDNKLRTDFLSVIENGTKAGNPISKNDFALEFVVFLLRLRFLFDKYIIKREYTTDNPDGVWSLKEFFYNKGSYCYSNTLMKYPYEREYSYGRRHSDTLMIQSCLRVSYTSPRAMHWITDLLSWLYREQMDNSLSDVDRYLIEAEKIAANAVQDNYLSLPDKDLGTATPHIVFNFLDYLLWKNGDDKDFAFEFRNSVEHWYPQNPSEGTFSVFTHEEGLDSLGNLCLLQRSENSRFSNLSPLSKLNSYEERIRKGSLKLRIMANATTDSEVWRKENCKRHGEEMMEKLKQGCIEILGKEPYEEMMAKP